jgi:hypothetical protein
LRGTGCSTNTTACRPQDLEGLGPGGRRHGGDPARDLDGAAVRHGGRRARALHDDLHVARAAGDRDEDGQALHVLRHVDELRLRRDPHQLLGRRLRVQRLARGRQAHARGLPVRWDHLGRAPGRRPVPGGEYRSDRVPHHTHAPGSAWPTRSMDGWGHDIIHLSIACRRWRR